MRVPLHGRRVGGWVLASGVTPPPGVRLQAVAKVTGLGPSPDLVELTEWAAWRWAGRRTALLRAASPLRMVRGLPAPSRPAAGAAADLHPLAADALSAADAVVRLPPAADPWPIVEGILSAGPALVVCPTVEAAGRMAARIGRCGLPVARLPDAWARAAAGGATVVGARAAAWGPAPDAAAIVVLDAHDRALVEERAPAWSAWVVAAERARRRGIPCVLLSPCPTLEQLQWGRLVVPSRSEERAGWAPIEVVDRAAEDPRAGLLGAGLVPVLRAATAAAPVVCVLNRKGRARLLACRACGQLSLCERCGQAVALGHDGQLACPRCGAARPKVCQACGSGALKSVRSGVTRLREEVEDLARLPSAEVTAETADVPEAPLLVGTEAVLHRLSSRRARVAAVVFLDFDIELHAPRLRAGEEALALLAEASRITGGKGGGRVVVQTRQPGHPVLEAAVRADPGLAAAREAAVRAELDLPPFSAVAALSGQAEVVAAYASGLAGVQVSGPDGGRYLVRAPDHRRLCDALAEAPRPTGANGATLRVEVDPLGI